MFSCNLPHALLAEWPGSLCAIAVTRGWNRYRNKSPQKADPGKENSLATPAGTWTQDLSLVWCSTTELSLLPSLCWPIIVFTLKHEGYIRAKLNLPNHKWNWFAYGHCHRPFYVMRGEDLDKNEVEWTVKPGRRACKGERLNNAKSSFNFRSLTAMPALTNSSDSKLAKGRWSR